MNDRPCLVCGYLLDFEPWRGNSPADEICPCCGIQYGYDDEAGGDLTKRREVYGDWRRRWIDGGMRWWSKGRKPPSSWNPVAQLARTQKP
jgi:hypothetical protein